MDDLQKHTDHTGWNSRKSLVETNKLIVREEEKDDEQKERGKIKTLGANTQTAIID